MKFVYNINDMILEYTSICLANISAGLAEYNLPLAIIVSLIFGQVFVLDFIEVFKVAFKYSGAAFEILCNGDCGICIFFSFWLYVYFLIGVLPTIVIIFAI